MGDIFIVRFPWDNCTDNPMYYSEAASTFFCETLPDLLFLSAF